MISHENLIRPSGLDQAAWRRSARSSGSGNGNCVEAASLPTMVAVRDSKLAAAGFPVLTVDRREWPGFLATIRSTT